MKAPSSRRFEGLDRRRHGLRNRLRRIFHGFGGTRSPLASADISGWAADLYRSDATDSPLHGAVFTIEQLELHARAVAATHVLDQRRGDDQLLRRLGDSERVIDRCHLLLSRAHAAGRRMAPAAEWLLDNRWVIEEQISLAREHFPRGYSRGLPRLKSGKSAGLPRIYDIILEFIAHVDGRVDEEALARYTAAYQSVTPLTLGELWSVDIMLRLALVENLRRVTVSMSWQQEHRDRAIAWAQRIGAISDSQDSAFLALADMVREDPPLSTAFVSQFTQALEGRGATTTLVLAWLEQRLADRGQTIEGSVQAESHGQAAAHASMANTISSLRFVSANEWYEFVETHSTTEKILRDEPAGVYDRMDFATRDEYRHVVEAMAQRFHVDENEVARTAVALAATSWAAQNDDVAAHVGYLLVDDGKRHLERALRGLQAARLFPRPLLRKLKLAAYPRSGHGALGLRRPVSGHAISGGLPDSPGPFWRSARPLAASQFALAIVNWLASVLGRPRALPRMDFEHGIPDDCRTMVVVPTILTDPGHIDSMMEGLERRYLANRDPNLWFALLTDFSDADQEHVDGDDTLLALATAGIEELITKYGNGAHGRFFLFQRPRLYNAQEGCWMGHERKRGKARGLQRAAVRNRSGVLQSDRGRRVTSDLGPLCHHPGHRHRPALGGGMAAGGRRRSPAESSDDGRRWQAPGPRLRDPPAACQYLVAQRHHEPLFAAHGRRRGLRPIHAPGFGPVSGSLQGNVLHRQGHLRCGRLPPVARRPLPRQRGVESRPARVVLCTLGPVQRCRAARGRAPPGTCPMSVGATGGCGATGRSPRGWA